MCPQCVLNVSRMCPQCALNISTLFPTTVTVICNLSITVISPQSQLNHSAVCLFLPLTVLLVCSSILPLTVRLFLNPPSHSSACLFLNPPSHSVLIASSLSQCAYCLFPLTVWLLLPPAHSVIPQSSLSQCAYCETFTPHTAAAIHWITSGFGGINQCNRYLDFRFNLNRQTDCSVMI